MSTDNAFSVFFGFPHHPVLGGWVEITPGMSEEEIEEERDRVISAAAAASGRLVPEEIRTPDAEEVPYSLIGEWASPGRLAQLAEAAEAAEDRGISLEVLAHVADQIGIAPDDMHEIPDHLIRWGDWDEAIAQFVEGLSVPESFPFRYLDQDAIRRDLEIEGTYFDINGTLYEYTR